MVIHVVMFKFKDDVGNALIKEAREKIEQMIDLVPRLLNIKIGMNFADEDRAMDMVLISHFETKDDLDFYANHPEHLKVLESIKRIAEYTKVVDFEA
ncbi:MAG: Dabb family protein [Sulfurovum sp.]|nr:Dabb family protein [Sulfurovum sp.]